jgi:predicted nucleic acid-binding Zn finger protein
MKQTEVSRQLVEKRKDRRSGKARVLALSRNMYQLRGMDTFYEESESFDNRYYFVRFNSSFSGAFCSCKDYESKCSEKCKHQYAVEYEIRFNTIKEVEHLPEEVRNTKRDSAVVAHKYENEHIRTLNDIEKAKISPSFERV